MTLHASDPPARPPVEVMPAPATEPLVSIVIPCFNAERWVGEAIQSALDQTYSNKEVIVIDDGSTDRSLDVIRSFGPSIRWETGPNRGGCAARNQGLDLARGALIQFLDSDDLLHVDKLRLQVPLLLTDRRSCVFCNIEVVDLATGSRLEVVAPKEQDSFLSCCFDRIQTGAPLHWKDTIQQIGGFDEELPCAQEFDLHLRLACAGIRFRHLPHLLTSIRRRPGSVSSDEVRLYRVMGRVLTGAARLLDPEDPRLQVRSQHIATKIAACGRWLLRFGDVAGGMEAFRAALEVHASGGLVGAYSAPALMLRRIAGPVVAERLLWRMRRLRHSVASHQRQGGLARSEEPPGDRLGAGAALP